MTTLLLVRHGQASFGAEDYDVLSPTGEEQARVLGQRLRASVPDLVVHGTLQRQRRTAEELVGAAGWPVPTTVDPDWDEFDPADVLAQQSQLDDPQEWFDAATDRWSGGEHDADYAEPFGAFTERVETALAGVVDQAGLVVVVTSGGPIAWIAAGLLESGLLTYRRLTRVVVNTGVTTVVRGRSGTNLVTFNDHAHLSAELVTYR